MSVTAAPDEPATDLESAPPPENTRSAVSWSVGGHLLLLIAAIVLSRGAKPLTMPPAYSVELVAAPPGARALGAVDQGPDVAPPVAEPTPAPPEPTPEKAEGPAARKPVPKPIPRPAATPKPPVAPTRPATPTRAGGDVKVPGATRAGGGPTGGRGSDVASVRVQGTAFPYPGYLQNITRQIAMNFKTTPGVALRAEVTFLIHRDGSVSDLRLLSRSGTYAFDLECLGAVEAVGQRRAFGPLPAGFRDDVLPVVFSFDPSVLR